MIAQRLRMINKNYDNFSQYLKDVNCILVSHQLFQGMA